MCRGDRAERRERVKHNAKDSNALCARLISEPTIRVCRREEAKILPNINIS